MKDPPYVLETHAMTAAAATSKMEPTVQRLVSGGFSTPGSTPGPTSIVTWSRDFGTVLMTIARLRPYTVLTGKPPYAETNIPSEI